MEVKFEGLGEYVNSMMHTRGRVKPNNVDWAQVQRKKEIWVFCCVWATIRDQYHRTNKDDY